MKGRQTGAELTSESDCFNKGNAVKASENGMSGVHRTDPLGGASSGPDARCGMMRG